MDTPDILFLTLRTFSATGGIEKVCRLAAMAMQEEAIRRVKMMMVYSAYDNTSDVDERYIPGSYVKGFGGSRKVFAWQSIRTGVKAKLVVLSHINLLPVGYTIKKLSPTTKLVLIAHGIEVWDALLPWKRLMLKACDRVLPVSRFTSEKLLHHGLDSKKLQVVNNAIDPFLPLQADRSQIESLRSKYGFAANQKIILTLTRLEEKERPKGYDNVLLALKHLKEDMPGLRYLLVGKYTTGEKTRLDALVKASGLESEVIMPGYISDEEIAAHFALADVFIMPSQKEGFGIVFIEALYYGLPVIAGNKDGSVDALAGGKFGHLVDPDSPEEIRLALQQCMEKKTSLIPAQGEVLAQFGFPVYKKRLWTALDSLFQDAQGQKRQSQKRASSVTKA
ncbi:MAG: glycosyltransferase family 1 protein [Sphingobacteriales bacterium]|nr:MAG: glycosyltransferase family 1 protein [Sphingobacteriales bacterium]